MTLKTNKNVTLAAKNSRTPSLWPRVYVSIKQISGATGISIEKLKSAKNAGCPGFLPGGRIDLQLYLRWSEAQPAVPGQPLLNLDQERARKLSLESEALEDEKKIRNKSMVNLGEVDRLIWENILLPLKVQLEAMPDSLGPMANPTDPAAGKKTLREWWEKTKSFLRSADNKK